MTIKQSCIDIYAALKAVHADLAAVSALSGMDETVEFISLSKNIDVLHTALNEFRKLLGMTWDEFLIFIGEASATMAMTPPGGGTTNVGGAGGKDD